MKLYFHLQLPLSNSVCTAVVETGNADGDIKSCLLQLSNCLLTKVNTKLDISNVQVFTEKEKGINLDTILSTLSDGTDLIVRVNDDTEKNKIIYEKSDIRKVDDGYADILKEQAINSIDKKETNKDEISKLLTKSEKLLLKKRGDLAILCFKEVLDINPNDFHALSGLAYIYYNAERYKDCIPYFERAISKGSPLSTVLLDFGQALSYCGEAGKAVSVISRCISDLKRSNQPIEQIHDANVVLGEVLESMGQLQNAFQIYLSIAQMTDKQHLGALIGYARLGYQLKCVCLDDVFVVVLNALAVRKNDAKFQAYFVDMIKEKDGYEILRKQMQDLWRDAPTVVFIANFLREGGALNECLKLLKHAFSLTSANVNVALLIFHVYENLCLFQPGLAFVAEFFNGMLERQVVRKIDLSPFVKVIRLLDKNDQEELNSYISLQLAPEKEDKKPSPKGTLANVELELLGLYFTVVKTCFVNGYLRPMPLFIKLLDPLFKINEDLHKTLIRNEQAYYSCISQLYKSVPPTPNNNVNRNIYFIGDSHVLPVAWRRIRANDQEFCLHPVLVTGLKIWHLRKDCQFYTKKCFQQSLKLLPHGSVCIFAFGEIDCREGIIDAVQKCKYNDIEECIKDLVEIYVKCLLDAQKQKKSKIFVHPVPPVHKITIENVRMFNEHLRNRIAKTPKLFWLDLFDELLDNNGCLKGEYELDGAHLHPKYIDLLEKGLQEHM